MQVTTVLPDNDRIDVADVLRGFAVMGITLIHFIERFSLYSYPEETAPFFQFTDRIIWDSIFFAFSGKAYCIFALLFGFTFFIQDHSQKQKGKDFRLRFAWRLVLLFFIACINSTLFPGEILMLYALLGYVMIAFCRFSTRTVFWISVFLLSQPIEWIQLILALLNPAFAVNAQLDAPSWEIVNAAQKEASFLELSKITIWTGNIANMGWMLLHGRVTQTAGLFLVGMLIGRARLLPYSEKNNLFWMNVFIVSTLSFFRFTGWVPNYPISSLGKHCLFRQRFC